MAQTTEGPSGAQPAYHLLLAPDELPVLRTALELLIADSRDHQILSLARAVLERTPASAPPRPRRPGPSGDDGEGDEDWATSIPLAAGEMKIVHTAVHLLRDDLQREQADELHILQQILEKLPDEHAIRAISLD